MTIDLWFKLPDWLWPNGNKQIIGRYVDLNTETVHEISTSSRLIFRIWRFWFRRLLELEYRELDVGK